MSEISRERALYIVDKINIEQEILTKLSDNELRRKVSNDAISMLPFDDAIIALFAALKEFERRLSERDVVVDAAPSDMTLAQTVHWLTIEGEKTTFFHQWLDSGHIRRWSMVYYDEQLLAGVYMAYKYAIQMATGEGKTLVATLPAALMALRGSKVHIATTNSYLASRDLMLMRPIYAFCKLSCAFVEDSRRDLTLKKKEYKADIVYARSSTFIFDYLFDHLECSPENVVQSEHDFAIVDEVDSVLIDEGTTPHIIVGQMTKQYSKLFEVLSSIVEEIVKDRNNYSADFVANTASFTPSGQKLLKKRINGAIAAVKEIINKFDCKIIHWAANALLQAYILYIRDIDYIIVEDKYIVEDKRVVIVDKNTGRPLPNHTWEDGISSAVEAKEKVDIRGETISSGQVSVKNYYKLYSGLSGMSGTVKQVTNELSKFNLKVACIPSHRKSVRKDARLRSFLNLQERDAAIIDYVSDLHKTGRPVLFCCQNPVEAKKFSESFRNSGIENELLVPQNIIEESLVIANAGNKGQVTVTTAIASRGTDIIISDEVAKMGGLAVVGVSLSHSRRVDNQMRGRAGRQGQPGSSAFFVSAEDKLMDYLPLKYSKLLNCAVKAGDVKLIGKLALKAQSHWSSILREERRLNAKRDDSLDIIRKEIYRLREEILMNRDALIIKGLFTNVGFCLNTSLDKISGDYVAIRKYVELVKQKCPNHTIARIPYGMDNDVVSIQISIFSKMEDKPFVVNEVVRQTLFQILDREWTKYAANIGFIPIQNPNKDLSNLINRIITNTDLFLNQCVLLIRQDNNASVEESNEIETQDSIEDPKPLSNNQLCPCGSGKFYAECHGKNKRKGAKFRHIC